MSGLFAPKVVTQAPAPVTPAAPAPMPDNTAPAVVEAQRKTAAAAMARAGRMSTILTDTGNSGPPANQRNTDSYSSRTLGAGG